VEYVAFGQIISERARVSRKGKTLMDYNERAQNPWNEAMKEIVKSASER
jgi:hypothetical protein